MWPFRTRAVREAHPPLSGNRVLSVLAPQEVAALGGLCREAIAGVFDRDEESVDTFWPNPAFVEFMHSVIQARGPEDPGLRQVAAAQGNGWVYVIDLRTVEGPSGNVPTEDIVGGFKVEAGQIRRDSYWRNGQHKVFTAQGLVRLPPTLHAALVEELRQHPKGAG